MKKRKWFFGPLKLPQNTIIISDKPDETPSSSEVSEPVFNRLVTKKSYLGDGLYVEGDECGVWITSEDGVNVLDRIYLEWNVYQTLKQYMKNLGVE